ncbi:MAG: hypothetical protein KDC84_01170 [Crocinitomicaceae bacterium]|nr:hypothetical protein [Crocinitomicaceae bacterium]
MRSIIILLAILISSSYSYSQITAESILKITTISKPFLLSEQLVRKDQCPECKVPANQTVFGKWLYKDSEIYLMFTDLKTGNVANPKITMLKSFTAQGSYEMYATYYKLLTDYFVSHKTKIVSTEKESNSIKTVYAYIVEGRTYNVQLMKKNIDGEDNYWIIIELQK